MNVSTVLRQEAESFGPRDDRHTIPGRSLALKADENRIGGHTVAILVTEDPGADNGQQRQQVRFTLDEDERRALVAALMAIPYLQPDAA